MELRTLSQPSNVFLNVQNPTRYLITVFSNVSCKSDLDSRLAREYAREGVGPSDPRTCTGLARTGEKATITTGGFVQPDKTVQKVSEKPTFN